MADTTVIAGTDPLAGMTIGGMGQTPAHAKPKDHLWVLAVVAAACLIKVWPSWVDIGAEAGFPKIIKMPTDWTLAVVVEAYWAYAVYAWLAASAGRRSRKFAMWSAGGVFLLSLTAQSSASLMSAKAAGAFANAMPVTILALIAVLVHLRHLDRAEAAEAVAMTAAAQELATLRADLSAQREALSAAQSGRDEAQREAAEVTAKAEVTERKLTAALAASAAAKRARKTPQKKTAAAPSTKVPRDVDVQAQALAIIAAEPGIKGKDLGPRVGRSERWGQEFKNNLTAAVPNGQDPES